MHTRTLAIGLALLSSIAFSAVRTIATGPSKPESATASQARDGKDWPMYNYDVIGWRFNAAEKALSPANVGQLEEKWRFPPKGADFEIGAIHATPVVVDGYVYFGTANKAAFYKLTPDGKQKWCFRLTVKDDRVQDLLRNGVYCSALVSDDTVYFGTLAGIIYALDKETGEEKWRVDMTSKTFPGAHSLNGIFASPIMADDKVIIAGGALEQVVKRMIPFYQGYTGRGFVMALEPQTGKIAWKYDVGPKPERFDPPLKMKDDWGEHVFHYGPATSMVWSTPSYHADTQTIFFGTDAHTAPRRPTNEDPRLDTDYACAIIAIDARNGKEKWVRQLNPGDVWNTSMRAYDSKTGRYLDQSIGDTPRVFSIMWNGVPTLVIAVGCKNGGFYIIRASDGVILTHTPIYNGPPTYPLNPLPDKRTLALPSPIGGLQTGCATDGKRIYTNGIDALRLGTQQLGGINYPPTGGRVVSISMDTKEEYWRHERPKVAMAASRKNAQIKETGDPVASGIAVANGVVFFTTLVSNKLMALDAATGKVLREILLPPVWSGPSVSRGRVYVGTGNVVIPDMQFFCPMQSTGTLFSFGLPGEDEVSRMGGGKE